MTVTRTGAAPGPSLLRTAQPPLRRSGPGIAAGSLSALSAVALLAASAYLITRAAEQPPILYLTMAMVGVRAFALARAAFRYLERLSSHDASFRQLAVVRTELYRRLSRVAPAGLGRTDRGDLLARVVSDVDALQDLPLRVVQPLVVSGVTGVAAVVGVAVVSPRAALVLAGGLVVALVVGVVLADRLATGTEAALAARRGALSGAVLDTVQSLDVLVAFDALEGQLRRVAALDDDLRRASRRRATTAGLVAALLSLVSGATVVGVVLATAGDVAAGELRGPAFALVALVPIAVLEVVGAVPTAVVAWRRVRASGARVESAAPLVAPAEVVVDELDEAEVEVDGRDGGDGPAALPADLPVLSLEHVSARWPGAATDSLVDATLEVRAGDRVVVEGPSGAGKSTLAAVLVRFLEHRGRYEVGGTSVRSLGAERVRGTVGLIEQSPWLFDESIRQNLLFARDTATDDDLLAVLDRVDLGDWVRERGGLDARPGERGALVSGGQAQRLSLARALLRGFPVLVLDEPTAGLDAELADRLVTDLLEAARDDGTTVVLISHVPVPAALVTRRVRVDRGVLRDVG
ncbi:thiol reductant ABC exporter subunit CydC [Frigoribacterium endophyticum]|uniref:thiol reductant ABC exporter subunit CydC n=1 Tax=Frigoribacterium endophyticum TaxID=1522176 RepID=UPI0014229807|nr:thiol reductant ABC exporter subunit CydC [Frigoribacterium endophyticum]NII50506.1 ATP-binding cassette subfamily C protein CydC [Frigoribacterium endophyticum]